MGWKLVRDKNEIWCRAHGVSGQWRTSPDPVAALRRKVFEEAAEYAEQHDAGELYDLLDVLLALLKLEDPYDEAYRAHAVKTDELGGFGRFIEWTPVPAGVTDMDERAGNVRASQCGNSKPAAHSEAAGA